MQTDRRFSWRIVTLALACWLSACAAPAPFTPTTSDAPRPDVVEPSPAEPVAETAPAPPPAPTAADTAPRARTLSAASRALVNQSHAQLAAGNDALAAATLERALRIEPDHPQLWLELAKVRLEEGNAAQAENLARKALAMAVGDGATQAAAWRVIAQSYRVRGRNPEAREAEVRAQALER